MKRWKRFLSHLIEVPIETTDSSHHKHLQVNLIKGRYQLSTERSIYSFDDLYLNFYKAFTQLELPPDRSDCLVLGLGLGSIPWMLENSFARSYQYVAVDLDEEVIRLASSYRLKELQSPMEIICSDAVHFAHVDQRTYDLICVDVFLDDVVPTALCSPEVISVLREKLSEGGLLLWNRLFRTTEDQQETKKFFENEFKQVFGSQAEYLDVDGNWILIGRV